MVTVNKNILLIGRTGNGKSSLANVLSGTDEFAESADSTSETRSIKDRKFEIDGVKYCVIDTIGVGDTQLDTKAVLFRLGEIAHFIEKEGLNQIFFVTSGRFTKEEIEAYKLLSSVIFDQNVFNYTTIVRTNFPNFEDENACERDRNKLCNESGELSEIFSHAKIIYVDNPALLGRPAAITINKETRELSRKRLLTYLGTIIHKNYLPTNLKELNDRIRSYMTEKERLEEEIKKKEREMREMFEAYEKKLQEVKDEMDRKIKESEAKKDKEREELETKLNEDIKKLEKEGKANEETVTSLKKDYEEEKKKSEEKWQKEIDKINKEKEDAEKKKNEDNEVLKNSIKNLESQVDDLKTKNKGLEEKVANEVGKQIETKVIVQKSRPSAVASIGGGAASGAVLGSYVPVVGTAIGATAGAVVGTFCWMFGW